jgi:Subtilase family/Bacterial pre-peptidase C-terminal domain
LKARQVLRILALGAFLFALLPLAGGPAPAAVAAGNKNSLSKHDRELLADAQASGSSTVTMLIAAVPGANNTVIRGLNGLGATVRYQDGDVSYIRAVVPIGKAEAAAQLAGVQAANLDEVIPLDDPAPEATNETTNVAPPGPDTQPQNPYMPTQDIGAPQFVAAHPTYDGRGVKVGILDTGIDLLTPELQTAKALDGTPVRKIVDWVTYTDPATDGDPTWINMKDQVTASGGTFTYKSVTYTAPANGTYRVGLFNEASLGAGSEYGIGCGADLDRDGACGATFAVLWNTTSNNVWVDTNHNHSFADQAAMTDYKVRYDMGTFGTNNPATAIRESVPFVVQTDGQNKYVNIGIVSGAHGTHVAGIATGKGFFGGAFNGAAPEAQVVAIRVCLFVSGCTAHALVEGMIYAEKQANVDVINMSIGGLPALNDGNNTRAILYNRLITQYKAQMFFSAGNDGPGVNTLGDPAVATNAMAVGAYVTKDSWMANYGADAAKDEGLFVFSSRGPREDGGFKPNIVAPGSAVSSVPGWQPGQPVGGTYVLPPGYGMFNGTSMAAPQATGGAALLISAAKQNNVQWQPDQLRQAINSSARYLPAYGAHEQGNGLFQVGAAWDLLKTNIKTVGITSSAPVNTIISQFLATPNVGTGIYEREGWAAGDTRTRTITFTRTTGGSRAITYNLTWVGNDGTFSSAGSIALPLNRAVSLPVNINAGGDGVHSAILNLDDPATTGVDYGVLNTIIAAGQFSAINNFTVSYSGSADRPDKASFFFYVPANTPAFKVDVTDVTGRVRLLRFHPYGSSIDNTSTTPYQTGGTQSRTLSNPQAGVWEVTVDASRTSPVTPATFTVTGSILGVDVSPTSWVIDPATVGTQYNQTFSFTNRFGAFTGRGAGTALGSAFSAHPTIAAGGSQQQYSINVPAGSTSISVRIGNASDNAADLDLYLFDCHTTPCVLKASSTSGSANESVSVANPAAGPWVALVDPYAVPSGSTTYDYLDVVANPAFGAVSVTDTNAVHANNATWTAPASVTANTAPGAGRFLQGFVQVVSGSSVLGSAEVDLKNVAP